MLQSDVQVPTARCVAEFPDNAQGKTQGISPIQPFPAKTVSKTSAYSVVCEASSLIPYVRNNREAIRNSELIPPLNRSASSDEALIPRRRLSLWRRASLPTSHANLPQSSSGLGVHCIRLVRVFDEIAASGQPARRVES